MTDQLKDKVKETIATLLATEYMDAMTTLDEAIEMVRDAVDEAIAEVPAR